MNIARAALVPLLIVTTACQQAPAISKPLTPNPSHEPREPMEQVELRTLSNSDWIPAVTSSPSQLPMVSPTQVPQDLKSPTIAPADQDGYRLHFQGPNQRTLFMECVGPMSQIGDVIGERVTQVDSQLGRLEVLETAQDQLATQWFTAGPAQCSLQGQGLTAKEFSRTAASVEMLQIPSH